jgi:hypothetical protein
MKKPASPEVDAACYFLVISNSLSNVLVIYFFDYEIHRSVNTLFKNYMYQSSKKTLILQSDEKINQMGVEMNAKFKNIKSDELICSGNSPNVVVALGDTQTIKLGNAKPRNNADVNNVDGDNEAVNSIATQKINNQGGFS